MRTATSERIREEYARIQPYSAAYQQSLDALLVDWYSLNPHYEDTLYLKPFEESAPDSSAEAVTVDW